MWKKASEHYPFMDWHIGRLIGTTKRMPLMFTSNVIAGSDGKTYKKEEIEWLDEREPSFTLENMKSAFNAGSIYGWNNVQKTFESWWEQAETITL